ILMLFAAVMLFDQVVFIGTIGIPAILYIPLKQRITYPRLGYIRFDPEAEQRRKYVLLLGLGVVVFVGLVVLNFLVGALPEDMLNLLRTNDVLILGVLLGLFLGAVAYFLKNRRFYLYAGMVVLLVWSAHFLGFRAGIAVMVLGAALEATGVYILLRFLKKYPVEQGG
ncbi:MAG: hypothetical protein JXB38_13215, partial [Anaerolineales bacterium]|nr:hypothetical protein [Anaerolineales bacterium]